MTGAEARSLRPFFLDPHPVTRALEYERARQLRVCRALRTSGVPMFAVLDRAGDAAVRAQLAATDARCESLGRGGDSPGVATADPVLVDATSDVLIELVAASWGRGAGIWLCSRASFGQLRRHLQSLMQVRLPDGQVAQFRFYEPRTLNAFVPLCRAEQARQLFGPVASIAAEDRRGARLNRYSYVGGRSRAARAGEPALPVEFESIDV